MLYARSDITVDNDCPISSMIPCHRGYATRMPSICYRTAALTPPAPALTLIALSPYHRRPRSSSRGGAYVTPHPGSASVASMSHV